MSIKEFRTVTEFISLAFVAGFLLGGAVLRADDADATSVTVEEKTAVVESTSTEPLNTAPQPEIVVPPGRPEWVDRFPVRNNKSADETTVCSDPFKSRAECLPRLDAKIQEAVDDYIVETTGSKLAPKFLNYELVTIKDRLIPRENYYEETSVSPSVGPMHQIHARMQFDGAFRKEIENRWLELRAKYRVGQIGLGFAAVLGVLATIAGYFRADNASRGYYTGRLQWLAAGAILALIVLGAFFARLIPWV